MISMIDQIESFRLRQENLKKGISLSDFFDKLNSLEPRSIKWTSFSREEIWVRPGDDSLDPYIRHAGNYKESFSNLIKKHVKGFHEIFWRP